MSPLSWQEKTARILRDLSRSKPNPRLAVVGVGSREHGDDAAGPVFIDRLKLAGLPPERALLIDAGPSPESFTGPLRRFQPDFVLLVDAAWMNQPPGTVALIDADQIAGVGATTHGMSLSLLSGYLKEELSCLVALLAVQPAATAWDSKMGIEIEREVKKAAGELAKLYSKNISMCSPSVSS
jgi:hydrogenase 3 maturation protease